MVKSCKNRWVLYSSGNLIHCIFMNGQKRWDFAITQPKFAYKIIFHTAIGSSPFFIVYMKCHNHALDLVKLRKVLSLSEVVDDLAK